MQNDEQEVTGGRFGKSIVAMVRRNPALVLITLLTALLFWRLIALGQLTYGDIPFFDIKLSDVNASHVWGSEQLGTNVRQGFNTLRDSLIHLVAWNNVSFYFLKYTLPLLLIPFTYYLLLRKLGIRSLFLLVFGSLFPLFTPVVFGDFLGGQTFWIYLTIPWAFYYAAKIFCFGSFTFKNYIIFGLVIFLNLGMLPPIIVPLCMALGIFVAAALLMQLPSINAKLTRQYLLAGLVTGLTFILLASPYILAGASGQQAYSPSSLLGDYFHNYASTELVNTLRLSGNNGSGQTTLGYNLFSSSNSFGYLLTTLVFAGTLLLIGAKQRLRLPEMRYMIVALLVTMLAILGFLHLMATNAVVGVKVFESQWIVSTIRNPSKLYVLLLPIFTLLLAFSLGVLLQKARSQNLRNIIAAASVLALLAYGWPALRGDFGLLAGDGKTIANYRLDPVVQKINGEMGGDPYARSILVPANHSDELNYEKISPGLKTLGLQGSLPSTAKIISQTNRTLNAQNQYFFNYIQAIGIQNIFVKNNEKYYKKTAFSLFAVNTSAATINDFLGKRLTQEKKDTEYTHYTNPYSSAKLYAPENIINIRNDDQLNSKVAFMAKDTAVVSRTSQDHLSMTKNYRVEKSLPEGNNNLTGKAQLHDPTLIIGDLYMVKTNSKTIARFDIYNPITNVVEKSQEFDVNPDARVATINGQHFTFNEAKKRIALRAGTQQMTFSRMQAVGTKNLDASFEESHRASDGEKGKGGKHSIYASLTEDRTDGSHALKLGTSNHIAFVEKELPKLEKNNDYLISFDYKNNLGQGPRYSIINKMDKHEMSINSGRLDETKDWTTHEIFISADELGGQIPSDLKKTSLYLYSDTKLNQQSENTFDNIRVFKLSQTNAHTAAIDSYSSDYDLQQYHSSFVKAPEHNLIDNHSFEDRELWGEPQDATPGAPGSAKMQATQSTDAVDGKYSLKLSANNHTAYVAKRVTSFKPNTIYKVAFSYKNLSGNRPSFAIWQSGTQLASPRAQLTDSKDWAYFETFFIPEQSATNLTLYFYSNSRGGNSTTLFDGVTISEASAVSQYLIKETDAAKKPDNLLQGFQQQSPDKITARVQSGNGMLVWNESFSKGWKAYIKQRDGRTFAIDEKNHVTVNGFANGWWLETKTFPEQSLQEDNTYTVVLRYAPQQTFNKYLTISLLLFVIIIIYVSADAVRSKHNKHYQKGSA